MVYLINIYKTYTCLPREIQTISKEKKTSLHIYTLHTQANIYPYSNIHHYSEPRFSQNINNDGRKKRKKEIKMDTSVDNYLHMHM